MDIFTGSVMTREDILKDAIEALKLNENKKSNENGKDKEKGKREAAEGSGTTSGNGKQGVEGNDGTAGRGGKVEAGEGSASKGNSLMDVVHTLYAKGKEIASKLYGMKYFDVVETPSFMKDLGLRGDRFTIRYGVISRHMNKDSEHFIPESVWEDLPSALQSPFAITKYFADEEKKKQKGFRIFTSIQLDNGSFVIVSAEVKNAGKEIEVNAINTIFGRSSISDIHDELIYTADTITPEQQALLNGNNPHQYPAEREQFEGKGSAKEGTKQGNEGKNAGDTVDLITDAGEVQPKEPHPIAVDESVQEDPAITAEQIDTCEGVSENQKALAKDYLDGDKGIGATLAYNAVKAALENKVEEAPVETPEQPKKPSKKESASYKVGDIVENNGKKYRVISVSETAKTIATSNEEDANDVISHIFNFDEVSKVRKSRTRAKNAESKAESERPKAKKKPEAGSKEAVDDAMAAAKDFLSRFKNAKKPGRLYVSLIGLTPEQLEMMGEMFEVMSNLGYQLAKAGLRKFGEWKAKVKELLGNEIKDATGWDDKDTDDFIQEVWDTKYQLDGVRKPLSEWVADMDRTDETNPVQRAKSNKNREDVAKIGGETVSSQQQLDLFAGQQPVNEPQKPNDNGEETVQAMDGSTSAGGRGGQRTDTNGALGESERREAGRPARGRVDGRSGRNTATDVQRASGVRGLSESREAPTEPEVANPKNTRNNRAERGTDYAPKTPQKRYEANVAAIRLMQELVESGSEATEEQKAVLRKFSGWGGLGGYINNNSEELRQLLGDEGYESAALSVNSAYFTPASVIDALWDVAAKLGFKGGKVLEGSAGIGNILGLMPQGMSERSDIQAVEIDGVSGNILRLLYPDAKVDIKGFEEVAIPNNSVDLAITNVPFVTGLSVKDKAGDKDLGRKFKNIHDYCIAKNVRKLRPGGIGIFISSSGTLDRSKALRDWLVRDGGADVVGAFRLNNETFGGAKVTSDIIIVRKRVNGEVSPNAINVSGVTATRSVELDTGETKRVKGKEVPVTKPLTLTYNQYFAEHPESMGGEMGFGFEHGDTYRPESVGAYGSKEEQVRKLAAWVEGMKQDENAAPQETEVEKAQKMNEKLGEGVKEGSLIVDKSGNICVARLGEAVPLEGKTIGNKVKGHTKQECLEAYNAIKSALTEVLDYQVNNDSDEGLKPLLRKLNNVFDSFVRTYGNLYKNSAIAFLRNDVDFANILGLENVKEESDMSGKRTVKITKAEVFGGRVVSKEKDVRPENVKDGVTISLYKFGRIDVGYIAEQLGRTPDEVGRELLDSGEAFRNPENGQIEVAYEYLSDNVRAKLEVARANNADGSMDRNIAALEKVMPMDIPAHLIDYNLGSSWIDKKLFIDFIKEMTGMDVSPTLAFGAGTWEVGDYAGGQKNREYGVHSEQFNETIWGTRLIEAAMRNTTITVSHTYKHYDGTTETVTDKEATQACSARIAEIRQEFKEWAQKRMQEDAELAKNIEKQYNDQFNNYVPREIPLEYAPKHFGGAVTMMGGREFGLYPHQRKAVVRATTQPVLLAHEVGTGKTFTLITTAMEMRRLGTARKPMIVVQNATVGQFVASAKALYPNAKVLTIEDADRTGEGRKNFYAKIKYNDWDMIVVPQSVFERIPDSQERQVQFIHAKIEEKMAVLEEMKGKDGEKSAIVRSAEHEIEKLQDELADLLAPKDSKKKEKDAKREALAKQKALVQAEEMLDRAVDEVEDFDQMGIDALLVDEAHEYKHLGFATAMQRGVKGVDPSYSKKSQGVYLKCQAVLEKNNGKNVVFATGTPISNTAAEIWTFMRYLMPAETMKEYGIYYFDDFVRNFGNIAQMLEFSTSGKFRENTRFSGYVNLPELVRIWSGVADTALSKDQKGVMEKLPETVEGGSKATQIFLPQSKPLRAVMAAVRAELERYENMTGKEKKANSHIPLTMYGVAAAAAIDPRLVWADAADDTHSKTNEAVRQTVKALRDTDSYRGTVAIFADKYQNKNTGFNLYDEIKRKLVEQGVPEEQVVIMRSGMSIKKKLEIFDKVNAGEIRVILGSTQTLGTGVNIQERLYTLINMDVPNRPMDYTQRLGRILRQGNKHKEWDKKVQILNFGVEDSLDVTGYQRLKTKGAIADSIMNGGVLMDNNQEGRSIEEEEDSFGDTVATLSGSEYALLKQQAEREMKKLEAKKRQHDSDQVYVHNTIPRLEAAVRASERIAAERQEVLDKVRAAVPEGTKPTITVGKHVFASVDAMADFIKEVNKAQTEKMEQVRKDAMGGMQARVSSKYTVDVGGFDFVVNTVFTGETTYSGGRIGANAHRVMTYDCEALGLKDVAVSGGYIKNAITDIVDDVVSGKYLERGIEHNERAAERDRKELESLRKREGKPFADEEKLQDARERYAEYEEKMRKEMEEKEAKYAELDKEAESGFSLSDASTDFEEEGAEMQVGEAEPYTENSTEAQRMVTDALAEVLGETAGIEVHLESEEKAEEAARNNDAVAENDDFFTSQHTEEGKTKLANRFVKGVTVDTTKTPLPNDRNEAKRAAAQLERPFINEDQQKEIIVSTKAITHSTTQTRSRNEAKCAGVIDKIIRNAAKIGEDVVDADEIGKTEKVEIYYCPVNIDGIHYSARLVVKQYINRGIVLDDFRLYDMSVNEKKSDGSKNGTGTNALTPVLPSNFGYKVRELIHSTQINDKKILGIEQYDTEFMRVFHGSAAVFDHFDSSHFLEGEGSMVYGAGHYVTNVESTGRMYAGIAQSSVQLRQSHREMIEHQIEEAKKNGWTWRIPALEEELATIPVVNGSKQLYEIEIPDDNGSNYIQWDGHNVTDQQLDMIGAAITDEQTCNLLIDMSWDEAEEVQTPNPAYSKTGWKKVLDKTMTFDESQKSAIFRQWFRETQRYKNDGMGLYAVCEQFAGEKENGREDVAISAFLAKAGFVGIKVPTGNRQGGDGRGMNYVIFNDNDLQIKNRVEFLQTPSGTVYGWAVGNEIHLAPKGLNPNTPIHEYTHLWAKAVMKKAPKLWENVKSLLMQTPEWREVMNDAAYADIHGNEDAVASEVLSRLSGRNGARKMVEMAERMLAEAGTNPVQRARTRQLIDRVKAAITELWSWVGKNLFGIEKFGSVEEITDRVLYDLLNKTDLGLGKTDGGAVERQVVDSPAMVRTQYEEKMRTSAFQTMEALQDSMRALKEFQKIMEAETGREVKDFENAYMEENRLSSINRAEQDAYMETLMNPMLEHVSRITRGKDEAYNELERYMKAKHGLERNKVFLRRDIERSQEVQDMDEEIRKKQKELDRNPLDLELADEVDDLRRKRDEYVEDTFNNSEAKDYSGLTDMFDTEDAEEAEAKAREYVEKYEAEHEDDKLDELWDAINACTKATLSKLHECGMMDDATYEKVKGMFEYYVPLRGWIDDTNLDVYDYLGQKSEFAGSVLKSANGRKTEADNVLQTILHMASSAIMQGNRNVMKQKFLMYNMNHKNDLVSISRVWVKYDDIRQEWVAAFPDNIKDGDDAQTVARKMKEFEEQMEALAKEHPDRYKNAAEHPDINYIVVPGTISEHQIPVKMGGKLRVT